MKTPIYWCPKHDDALALSLGVVKDPPKTIPDDETYQFLLMERLQEYLESAPDPDQTVKALQRAMDQVGIEPMWAGPTEDAANALIYSNPLIPDYLRLKGLELRFPVTVEESSPQAQEAYEETTLEEWISLL